MSEPSLPPTVSWQSNVDLPTLSVSEDIAERLVLLAHYGADFDVWGGTRRVRYWDALTERVKASTYGGPTLSDWWTGMVRSLHTQPRNKAEREDLAQLLAVENQREVLKILRNHADVLVLRVRVISDARNKLREETTDGE